MLHLYKPLNHNFFYIKDPIINDNNNNNDDHNGDDNNNDNNNKVAIK